MKNRYRVLLILFLFSALTLSSFLIIDNLYSNSLVKTKILKSASTKLLEREKVLSNFLYLSNDILKSLRHSEAFDKYLAQGHKDDNQLKDLMGTMASAHTNFMQLRYIDADGIERIRIDRSVEGGTVFVVNKKELQNNTDKYYFSESKNKEPEKVWFSALDLNVEHGKLDIPYRPTMRAVLPIRYHDKFGGVLIINFFMEDFLRNFLDMPLYNPILLNQNGFIISHYEPNKSWGFYQNPKISIQSEMPEYKNEILNKDAILDNFVSKRLDTPIADGLILILKPREKYLNLQRNEEFTKTLTILLITLVISGLASVFILKIVEHLSSDLYLSKELTKELQELNIELAKQKDFFETISELVQDGVFVTDSKHNIIYANSAFAKITNIKKDIFLKSNLLHDFRDDKEEIIKFYTEAVDTLKPTYFEAHVALANGSTTWQRGWINPQLDMGGNFNGAICVASDFTKDRLLIHKSKLAALGEMVPGIAHQWRQPLAKIVSYLMLIKSKFSRKEPLANEALLEMVDKMETISIHLSDTLEDFILFFQPTKKKEYFLLSEQIAHSIEIFKSYSDSSKITIKSYIHDDVRLYGYPKELVQVINIILSNSLDACMQNAIDKPTIEITVEQKNGMAILGIADNAGGIDMKILGQIFEPYFTTKGNSKMGIGLYIAKMIIEKSCNGKITAKNNKGGVAFTIEL